MKENKWFEFAKEDLIVAQASLEKRVYNQVCFHSHQGVEKMLKGYLAEKDKDIPKTHFINVLLKLCSQIDGEFKGIIDLCITLASKL
jgi:HEPN domain-containing protein